ncbi:hypothetical protein [Pseudoduganella aquatica]|uniref:Uncharacterized protein n=1 Tax=Pseudoduganella aquatica TaxID=2660641 RepID=A0A7X4HER9_9BURK|nr:hypothetical protein [Pseudoduganella aquatica]MYN09840.1 hypothetical protein [Pseudoduganella aquatica]
MKKTNLPLTIIPQQIAIHKAVRAIGSSARGKPTKPKRITTLDLNISLKYRR